MLPRSVSVGSRRFWYGGSSCFRAEVTSQTNLVPRLWSGYACCKYDDRLNKLVFDESQTRSLGSHPTRRLAYNIRRDSEGVALSLKEAIVTRYPVTNGSSWNYRKIARISWFSTRRRHEDGSYASGVTKLRIPLGLLENSRIARLSFPEALFLGWLSKRLPESLEVSLLPPSNHKVWSDRTWRLFSQLEQSFK